MLHGATMRAKGIRTDYYNGWINFTVNYGVYNMALIKRKRIELPILADIENAAAGAEQNAISIEDVMGALVELGEIVAEQDDALVELAEIISE